MLIGLEELHNRWPRADTCIRAHGGDRRGRVEEPLNHSNGCDGMMTIMRARPTPEPFIRGHLQAKVGRVTYF